MEQVSIVLPTPYSVYLLSCTIGHILINYNFAVHCMTGKLWKQMAFHGG